MGKGNLHKKTYDVSIMRGERVVRKNRDKGGVDTSQMLKLTQFILKTDAFSLGHSDFGMCDQECYCSSVSGLPFFLSNTIWLPNIKTTFLASLAVRYGHETNFWSIE